MIRGFSTGAIALGDFEKGISMLKGKNVNAIELSTLREEELIPLIDAIDNLDLNRFIHISLHAPSKLKFFQEKILTTLLIKFLEKEIPIVVHPDIITDHSLWRKFGPFLYIENMDNRKPIGQTTQDLEKIFELLPEASFCLDIAHAYQVDPSMKEAENMLKKFSSKLKQIHISYVDSGSSHKPLNLVSILAFKKVSHLVNDNVSIIIESPVNEENIDSEIEKVLDIFENKTTIIFKDDFVIINYKSKIYTIPITDIRGFCLNKVDKNVVYNCVVSYNILHCHNIKDIILTFKGMSEIIINSKFLN